MLDNYESPHKNVNRDIGATQKWGSSLCIEKRNSWVFNGGIPRFSNSKIAQKLPSSYFLLKMETGQSFKK